ncbi:MAG: branched-chain amino acid ABC transporter permease [Gammaproteobacteria bacterium]
MEIIDVIQAVSDGVMKGSTYALLGIGFTLIFGVMHKLNLAYAAASIAGTYASLTLLNIFPTTPAFLVFLMSIIVSGILGYLVYLFCFRFIPLANPLATLMATVGMLFFIEEIVVHATEGMPQPYPAMPYDEYFEFGDYSIRGDLLLIFLLCLVATLLLLYMLHRTRLGIATRAVAQQPIAARLAGISIEKTNAITFVITGLLGGLAGAMIGASVSVLSPLIFIPFTVKGLIVTVIGGLGSIPGAIVAGLLVGGFEELFLVLRGVTERDLYVMLLLFVFLTFRPGGIFSRSVQRD